MTSAAHDPRTASAVINCVHAEHEVSLDTNPHSAFWRGTAPVYAEVDAFGTPLPRYRTEVRSRWTVENLSLLFVCPYEELHLKPSPDTVRETDQLWNWDVAELFIGSDFQNILRYKEFEVSPQGEWIDLDVDLALPHHEVGWTWSSGLQVAARIDRKASIWYGAMRIPFIALDGRTPAPGNIFRANLFRSQGPPERRKFIAWQAPMSATFHTPERFGTLELTNGK